MLFSVSAKIRKVTVSELFHSFALLSQFSFYMSISIRVHFEQPDYNLMCAFANEKHSTQNEFTQLANNYIHWDLWFFPFFTHTHRFWTKKRERVRGKFGNKFCYCSDGIRWFRCGSLFLPYIFRVFFVFCVCLYIYICVYTCTCCLIRSVAPYLKDYMFHFRFILIQINVACSFGCMMANA